MKVESTYKLLPGVEVNDEITKVKDSITAIFKAAEAYLIANPDAYNDQLNQSTEIIYMINM